jgi:hypothetical protein
MRNKLLLAVTLLCLAPVMAFAQMSSDFYVIPVASHTAGANNTLWQSDLAITNIQQTALDVQLVVIESGQNNNDNVFPLTGGSFNGSVSIAPNGSVLLRDILNGYRGMQNITGALLVGGSAPFVLTSRSYSTTPGNNNIGQTVTPARDFLDTTTGVTNLANAVSYVPGLINNAQFRTNLGFVVGNSSASGATMGLQVTLRDSTGRNVGQRLFSIPPGTFQQYQFPASSVSTVSFDIASAEFRITQGSGAVVPYASVIDNNTAAASFVLGQYPSIANPSGLGKAGFGDGLLRALFEQMRTH